MGFECSRDETSGAFELRSGEMRSVQVHEPVVHCSGEVQSLSAASAPAPSVGLAASSSLAIVSSEVELVVPQYSHSQENSPNMAWLTWRG